MFVQMCMMKSKKDKCSLVYVQRNQCYAWPTGSSSRNLIHPMVHPRTQRLTLIRLQRRIRNISRRLNRLPRPPPLNNRLNQGNHPIPLPIPHPHKPHNHRQPVKIIPDNRAIRSRVRPAKNSIEDAPATAAIDERRAAVDVPDRLADIVGARAGACFGAVAAADLGPGVVLEVPDSAGEEAGRDEVEEAGGDYEEDLEGCLVAAAVKKLDAGLVLGEVLVCDIPVDKVSHNYTRQKARHHGQRECRGREAQTDTPNEDDSLKTLTQDSNEGQDEHGVFLCPLLETPFAVVLAGSTVFGLHGLSQLDTPFLLELGDAKQGSTHDGDDHTGNQGEDTFPDVLCTGEMVLAEAVEGPDHATADAETDEGA